jgi:sugar phosphate isomerase/epimerase
MAADFRLGIQSYCFRKFQPLDKLTEALKACGLGYVELWPGHLAVETPEDERAAAFESLREAGIGIDSAGVFRFTADEAANRRIFEYCKAAGAEKSITADPDPDEETLALCDKLCEEYDARLAVHNHGRRHRWGHYDQLDNLFGRTGERIGLCLDTGWAIDAGIDPLQAARKYRDRLYGVHLKDFVYNATGQGRRDVITGTGYLDLPALLKLLDGFDYSGALAIEYEGNADAPLDDVKACVAQVQNALKQI